MRRTSLAVAFALAMLPMAAAAQEDMAAEEAASPLSWTAALTSDYIFRGVSQTNEDPALQLGLTYDFGNGFYAGAWGSNVDYAPASTADVEVDLYVGYATDFNDNWGIDSSLTRYNYFGGAAAEAELDYVELVNKLSYGDHWTFTFAYSPDIYNSSENGFYYGVDGSWDTAIGWSLHAGAGYSAFNNDVGVSDYADYKIGINREFGPVGVDITAFATDNDGEVNFGQNADSRLVLTLSIGG